MDNLLEILKIIDGGLKGDRDQVLAYGEQLARKLREVGDLRASERIGQALLTNKRMLHEARLPEAAPIPRDGESRLALADEEWVTSSGRVFLEEEQERAVAQFLTYLRASGELVANGVGISPSMLLYGPPGCGKTEVARRIACEVQLPLVTARADALISSYLGSTAKNLRSLFEHAMRRPCVLFLDEFDAVAKLRDDTRELGELKRVVVSLLQNIDALGGDCILIAATNHEHLLDPAIWRRFAYKLRLDPPSQHVRQKILVRFLGTFAPDDASVAALAAASSSLTGADLKQLAEDAVRAAVLAKRSTIDETETFHRILHLRIPKLSELSVEDRARVARDLDAKTFVYERLHAIFGISVGKLSQMFSRPRPPKGKRKNHAARPSPSNKGRHSQAR